MYCGALEGVLQIKSHHKIFPERASFIVELVIRANLPEHDVSASLVKRIKDVGVRSCMNDRRNDRRHQGAGDQAVKDEHATSAPETAIAYFSFPLGQLKRSID